MCFRGQKTEIGRLNARVVFLEEEKERLAGRVQAVKNAALEKLAVGSQRCVGAFSSWARCARAGSDVPVLLSLEALRSDVDSFKADSRKVSASVSEARALVTDVRDLKQTIAGALRGQHTWGFFFFFRGYTIEFASQLQRRTLAQGTRARRSQVSVGGRRRF